MDFFVGDVTSYTLHNLQPGTTYDVKVVAQYTGGVSQPLAGQGTTRTYFGNPRQHTPGLVLLSDLSPCPLQCT